MPVPAVAAAAAVARGGGAFLRNAWAIDAAWNLAGRVSGTFLPGFRQFITVRCTGGPMADMRRIWYLTLSTAFGRYRNRVRGAVNEISMTGTWDITNKLCQVEIGIIASSLEGLRLNRPSRAYEEDTTGSIRGGAPDRAVKVERHRLKWNPTPRQFIHRGPEQTTIGGDFPGWLTMETVDTGVAGAWEGTGCPDREGDTAALALGAAALAGVIKPFVPGIGTAVEAAFAALGPAEPTAPLQVITSRPRGFSGLLRDYPRANGAEFIAYPFRVLVGVNSNGATTAGRAVEATIGPGGGINLPDEGRIITTPDKTNPFVQPPAPQVDGIGRSSLLALVAQSLQFPCFLPTSPPCTSPRRAPGTGRFVYKPGSIKKDYWASEQDHQDAVITASNAFPRNGSADQALPGEGADGRRESFGIPPAPNMLEK